MEWTLNYYPRPRANSSRLTGHGWPYYVPAPLWIPSSKPSSTTPNQPNVYSVGRKIRSTTEPLHDCHGLSAARSSYADVVAPAGNWPVSLRTRLVPNRNPYLCEFRQLLSLQRDVDIIL